MRFIRIGGRVLKAMWGLGMEGSALDNTIYSQAWWSLKGKGRRPFKAWRGVVK